MLASTRNLLLVHDFTGDYIHACPYCRRYVKRERGIHICLGCYGAVNNDLLEDYFGRVNFNGGQSWLKNPIHQQPLSKRKEA